MNDFQEQILPEDPLPTHLSRGQLVELREHTTARLIWEKEIPKHLSL